MDAASNELLNEASTELQDSIHEHLVSANKKLPDGVEVVSANGDNAIGTLNQIQSVTRVGDEVETHLIEAKKKFILLDRADAIEASKKESLEEQISQLEMALNRIDDIQTYVTELIPAVPDAKSALEEFQPQTTTDTNSKTEETEDGTDDSGQMRIANGINNS